jgi:uncharacterized membrane protein
MTDGHSHISVEAPKAPPRTALLLAFLVMVVVALTTAGASSVWPSDYSFRGSVPRQFEGYTWQNAVVVGPADSQGTMTAVIDGKPSTDVRQMSVDPGLNESPEVGDHVVVLEDDTGSLIFSDFVRGSPMVILFLVYALIVLAVAWWRGLGALVGLLIAIGIILFFTVPSLVDGHSPLLVGLVTGSGALLVLLYLAHGINARTTTAYLGTIAGLAVTGAVGWWAVSASHLTGVWSDQGTSLLYYLEHASPPGLVLCGVILAGLGVLNDVTITQASAVWELRGAKPHADRRELFTRGMRIGRDHIASTVYTIAFAYMGAALPTIVLVSLYDSSVSRTLTGEDIAEEIVRTLVGSIGLVLAVPLTTLIAVLVAKAQDLDAEHDPAPPAPSAPPPA